MNLRRAEQFSPAAATACITSHKFELSRHGLVAVSHLLITSDEHKLRLLSQADPNSPPGTRIGSKTEKSSLCRRAVGLQQQLFKSAHGKISNFFPPSIVQEWLCQSPRTVARVARTEI